jgi:eukaryotic-like serine/threonine-protein kinase
MKHIGAVIVSGVLALAVIGSTVAAQRAPAEDRFITIVDRHGKIVRRGTTAIPPGAVALSPSGRQVALIRDQAIHLYDVGTDKMSMLTSGGGDAQPAWSADGKRIVFQSGRNGTTGVYQVTVDGKRQEQLLYSPLSGAALTGWSADGRYVNYHASDPEVGTGVDLWVLSVTDKKPMLILRTTAAELGARLSPDGRFVAYRSNESGRNEVYVRPFDPANPVPPAGAQKWMVSTEGSAGMVRWRSDGRELYFMGLKGDILAVPIAAGPTFKAEAPVVLFQTPPEFPLTGTPGAFADVSADGRRFLIAVPTGKGAPAR